MLRPALPLRAAQPSALVPALRPLALPALQPSPARRDVTVAARKAVKSVAPAPAAPPSKSLVDMNITFQLCTAYCAVIFAAMLVLPRVRPVRDFIRSNLVFIPLGLAYAALLAQSWSPDTLSLMMPGSLDQAFTGGFNPQFFPKLEGIQQLFARPAAVGSFWIHLLFVNLFFARNTWMSGQRTGVPTAHSIILAALFGPLGVLSHLVTKVLHYVWMRATGRYARPVVIHDSRGNIVILPTESADGKPVL